MSANLRTDYDLESAGPAFLADLADDLPGLLRYRALLPVELSAVGAAVSGPAPLLPAPRLASAIGMRRLWIKDESRGLSWSFKDRAAAVAAAHARASGAEVLVTASTGNAAAATAAHARRAGLTPVVVFARGVDPLMAAFVAAYGAHVAVAETKADRWRLVGEAVDRYGWYPMSNYADPPVGNNPYAIDGYKAIAFEIFEQLGRRVPEAVYFPVCYGDALAASRRAFGELCDIGLAERVPAHSGGEIYGTVSAALAHGRDDVPVSTLDHPTAASSISSRQSTFQALQAVRSSAGAMHTVSEDELEAALQLAVRTEGVLLEAASAAGLAALIAHRRDGLLGADTEVVLIASSSGVKSLGRRLTEPVTADVVTDVARLAAMLESERDTQQ
ncbi:MAG: pyridoxal-phosphate dependent enzyme [Mycobacterium sp.]